MTQELDFPVRAMYYPNCHLSCSVVFDFLSQNCESLILLCMQWLVFGMCWNGNEGLVCLINLVCLGTTQIELEGWISSPQPLNSTGREFRA